jgi:hypothetical protein
MDTLNLSLSRHDADLIGQALDVYAATLVCAPLGLGIDLMIAARALRDRLDAVALQEETTRVAVGSPNGKVVRFARG